MFNLVKGRSYDATLCCKDIPQWRVLFNYNHTISEFVEWILKDNRMQRGGISIIMRQKKRKLYMRFFHGYATNGKFPEHIMNSEIKEITASGDRNGFMEYKIIIAKENETDPD